MTYSSTFSVLSFPLGADTAPPVSGYPHRLALLPEGTSVSALKKSAAGLRGCSFFVDGDCADSALNGPMLPRYLRAKLPLIIYAQRARDLRSFLRRAEMFRRHGYTLEVLTP